jgi:phosphomannomutase
MTLIKSISGIRGTIGGKTTEGLNPHDIVSFVSAFAKMRAQQYNDDVKMKFIVGRDARISGAMVSGLVNSTLLSMGVDVIDVGLSTTPTVEMEVIHHKAQGGIIITASHNPKEWNALKFLNEKGEFINDKEGKIVLDIIENNDIVFKNIDNIGCIQKDYDSIKRHVEYIQDLDLVDVDAVSRRDFKVVIDAVNSTGGIAIPELFNMLGVDDFIGLYIKPTGEFPHNPEPLPENITALSQAVVDNKADIGFVVDPDVDRLAVVDENGKVWGEEYTLVAVADYILQNTKGSTVSNLSSSMALKDITEKYGQSYSSAAVGEVNVVDQMKKTNAVIGGEGNGGVIYPELHHGRDALVGIALILTYLAKSGKSASELRASYPDYTITKNKLALNDDVDIDNLLSKIKEEYSDFEIIDIDGVKIIFDEGWVHLRKSNTEPIIRVYSESKSKDAANSLAEKVISQAKRYL